MKASPDNFLRYVARCPLCGTANKSVNILLVEKRANRTGFHLTCPSCKTSMIVFLSQSGVGVVSIGAVTDVGRDDVALLQGESIPSDAILDLYTQIMRHDGSLASAIAPHRPRSRVNHKKQ